MKENKYDNDVFFKKYSEMNRSTEGLAGAGEWSELQKLLPDFNGKHVLDLGCGYGWHCLYAAEHGAVSVLGTDISGKMLEAVEVKSIMWVFILAMVRLLMQQAEEAELRFLRGIIVLR